MPNMKYVDALREAIRQEMHRDERIFLIGEALGGQQQGVFKVTMGLQEEFGQDRVIDTPISEACITGSAVGSAVFGKKPIAEIMFGNLMALCADEFHNQAAKFHYVTNGMIKVPMVIRSVNWGRLVSGPHHCGNLDSMIMSAPGIIALAPATPYDAMGLMRSALRQEDPVVFIEHSSLYSVKGEVPEDDFTVPISKAHVIRKGSDITVVAYSIAVQDALKAAERLGKEGISVEVIDLRTLLPYDKKTILESVKKTSRLVVAYDAYKTCGPGSEISAMVAEEAIEYLAAPIVRVAQPDVPLAANAVMVRELSLDAQKVYDGIQKCLS